MRDSLSHAKYLAERRKKIDTRLHLACTITYDFGNIVYTYNSKTNDIKYKYFVLVKHKRI